MEDGRIHIYGTMTAQNNTDLSVKGSYASTVVVYTTPTSDSYTLSATTEGNVRNSELHFYSKNTGPYDDGINLTSGTDSKTLHAQNYTWLMVRVPATTSAVDFYVTPMVSLTSIGNTDFEPFALPNYDLTRLQAEDRAALAEVVDSGAKNLVEVTASNISSTSSNVTVTVNSDKSIKITGNGSAVGSLIIISIPVYLSAGSYVLSGCPSGADYANGYTCDLRDTNNSSKSGSDTGNGVEFTLSSSGNYRWCIRLAATYTIPSGGVTFYPMVCTKAAFGVSQKFVPYAWTSRNILDSTGTDFQQKFYVDTASAIFYHNAPSHRCIVVFKAKVKEAISAVTVLYIGSVPSASYIPLGNVRSYWVKPTFAVALMKNPTNNVVAISVHNGSIPAETELNIQLEWTYI